MNPIVLITGALTGIGRATAVAFAKEGASIASGRREAEGKALEKPNSVAWEPKPPSFAPTCAMTTRCGMSTRLLRASAALTPVNAARGLQAYIRSSEILENGNTIGRNIGKTREQLWASFDLR